MIQRDKNLTKLFSGQSMLEKALRGRNYLCQKEKKTHTDIHTGSNVWVRDMICEDSCQEAHLLMALYLDSQYRIKHICAGIRYYFGGERYEDMGMDCLPKDITDILITELQKAIACIYVPEAFNPIGRPLPKRLLDAAWHPVGDEGSQWRCEVDRLIWNSHPPSKKDDLSSIAKNNSFFTTFPSDEARTYIVLSINTDKAGNVCVFEVDKNAETGLYTAASSITAKKADILLAQRLFIELESVMDASRMT